MIRPYDSWSISRIKTFVERNTPYLVLEKYVRLDAGNNGVGGGGRGFYTLLVDMVLLLQVDKLLAAYRQHEYYMDRASCQCGKGR